jgi:glycosyltransferase involved in cell wall biosynthesis
MKATPWVSVVVPCLNRAHLLRPTIDSILNQTYPLIECIIMDGGSTDATVEILKQYGTRIRWVSEKDKGHADAINKGWKLSKGEILAWLNADDVWEVPDSVSQAVSYFLEHPEADVVYGTCGSINEAGERKHMTYLREWDLAYAVEYCDHCIPQPAAFFRRSIVEKVGWLDITFISKKDHELWLRIGRIGEIHHIPVMLASERITPGTWSKRGDITAQACVALTKKFFRQTGLPAELQSKKRTAMYNAYIRGMEYAWKDGRKWRTVIPYAFRAMFANWENRWKAIATLQYYLNRSSTEHRGWRLISRLFAGLIGFWSRLHPFKKMRSKHR